MLSQADIDRFYQEAMKGRYSIFTADSIIETLEGGDEVWMTREEIGSCLGYVNPKKAIEKIHAAHKERLDSYSTLTKRVSPNLGGTQETRVYSAKGVYEICRWSRQPKADEFYDKVYDVLENIRINGYYSALPPEQLAAIVLEGVNDEWKLENVIIPALRSGKISQDMFVAKYMGLTADEFGNNPKLLKKSRENLTAKNTLDTWRRMKWRAYTLEDFPDKYQGMPIVWLAIDKLSKRSSCYGWFAEYCGKMYFNRRGYESIINFMVKSGALKSGVAQAWMADVLSGRSATVSTLAAPSGTA